MISTWGMGLTQHKNSVPTVQILSNLMMMRGNIGRRGAGLCPVRGHSNVQGDRTVGIEERPTQAFLDRLGEVYDFEPPREHGLDVVKTIQAMLDGHVKVFIGLGGNFSIATPDTPRTWEAMRACDLTVHITTKLNRSHLVHGRDALILPTLGRTEIDLQNGVAQGVSVEDSMSMVHISYGMNKPASENLLSEIAIVARMAHATLGSEKVDWLAQAADYSLIRDGIEQVIDGFHGLQRTPEAPGRLSSGRGVARADLEHAERQGAVPRACDPSDTPIHRAREQHGERLMTLMTTRSHDQYNTTIYGLDDRYRGVYGQRRVLFANQDDIAMLGFAAGRPRRYHERVGRRHRASRRRFSAGRVRHSARLPRRLLPGDESAGAALVGRRWRGHADVEVDSGVADGVRSSSGRGVTLTVRSDFSPTRAASDKAAGRIRSGGNPAA